MSPGRIIRRLEQAVLVAALAGATLLPLIEALGRFWGGLYVPGSAAYVRHLTMWLAFAGGLLATREGKHLMLSTRLPKNSIRTGNWLQGGKTSIIPPRLLICPGTSTTPSTS